MKSVKRDYYLYVGGIGTAHSVYLKNTTIAEARLKAWKMLDKYEKPVSVSKIVNKGKDTEYLGMVRRWGIAYDRYGIDRSDVWACWEDKNGTAYSLMSKGNIKKA